jgi:hypothetical protein
MNRYLLWIAFGSVMIVAMVWWRASRADDLQTHRLGDVATITLPSSFIAGEDDTSTYWPPEQVGNEELSKLRKDSSGFHFTFKSDPHSTLGGIDYRLWLNVGLFENRDALNTNVAEKLAGAALKSEDLGGGVRIVMQPDEKNYAGMLWIDEARLMRLHFKWRSDRYTPEKARKLLHDAAAGMVIDQDKRTAYFHAAHQFVAARTAVEEQNLAVLNAYLRSRDMPSLQMGSAAAKNGISYLVYRDDSQDPAGIVYFAAAKYVGEISEKELYGVDRHTLDQDTLSRAGFQADWSVAKSLTGVPPAASLIFMSGLAKDPTGKPPFPIFYYATVSSNLTLQTVDPQRLFDRLNAAQLPSPLPRL